MSRSSRPRLAIVLPTFRFDAAAKQALTLAASIGCDDICVHIGDNSGNPEKHAFLRDLAARSTNVVVTCHPRNIGAEPNWLFLVRAQTTPLICLACDDDTFARGYYAAGISLLMDDEGCSAASGLLLSVANDPALDVPVLYSPPQRLEPDPLTRIRLYNNQNAIAYAMTRLEAIVCFAAYVEQNPLKNAFNDYLLAFHLLSMGTYRLDRSGQAYVYDNDHWHLPQSSFETSAKFYVGCGLPESFAYFARLHWAVANLHFFRSTFRAETLSAEAAEGIARHLFDRFIREFKKTLRSEKRAITSLLLDHRDAADALSQLVEGRCTPSLDVFTQFACVVAAFSPDLASRYLNFLAGTSMPAPNIVGARITLRERLTALIRR